MVHSFITLLLFEMLRGKNGSSPYDFNLCLMQDEISQEQKSVQHSPCIKYHFNQTIYYRCSTVQWNLLDWGNKRQRCKRIWSSIKIEPTTHFQNIYKIPNDVWVCQEVWWIRKQLLSSKLAASKWQAFSGCPLANLSSPFLLLKFPQLKLNANKPGVVLRTVISS